MEEKIFKLKWAEKLGQEWMNIDNLKSCLFGVTKTSPTLLQVKDITPLIKKGLKKAIKNGIETSCEKCDDHCNPLNCKHFVNDIAKAVKKEFRIK